MASKSALSQQGLSLELQLELESTFKDALQVVQSRQAYKTRWQRLKNYCKIDRDVVGKTAAKSEGANGGNVIDFAEDSSSNSNTPAILSPQDSIGTPNLMRSLPYRGFMAMGNARFSHQRSSFTGSPEFTGPAMGLGRCKTERVKDLGFYLNRGRTISVDSNKMTRPCALQTPMTDVTSVGFSRHTSELSPIMSMLNASGSENVNYSNSLQKSSFDDTEDNYEIDSACDNNKIEPARSTTNDVRNETCSHVRREKLKQSYSSDTDDLCNTETCEKSPESTHGNSCEELTQSTKVNTLQRKHTMPDIGTLPEARIGIYFSSCDRFCTDGKKCKTSVDENIEHNVEEKPSVVFVPELSNDVQVTDNDAYLQNIRKSSDIDVETITKLILSKNDHSGNNSLLPFSTNEDNDPHKQVTDDEEKSH